VKDYYGNYSDYYLQRRISENAARTSRKESTEKTPVRPKTENTKPTYKQIKEYEALSLEIEQLEFRRDELLNNLNTGRGTPEELQQWSATIAELIENIDQKTDRWLELSEIVEG
jgi:ABC transport system ATP-binding/permease protein